MKTTNSIKNRLAKFAELTAALVLAAHFFVPAINIMAEDTTKTSSISFNTDNELVEVILNDVKLKKGIDNTIEYRENDETLSLTVKAPYDTIITTLKASENQYSTATSLLDKITFPKTPSDIVNFWTPTDNLYTISADIDVEYLISCDEEFMSTYPQIDIKTTKIEFSTNTLTQDLDHATAHFRSAINNAIPYEGAVDENGNLKIDSFPLGTKLEFTAESDPHYAAPTVKFNGETISAENGVYTITIEETNNLEISAEPFTSTLRIEADEYGETTLDADSEYLEGDELSFKVITKDENTHFLDQVTANREELNADEDGNYSFETIAGENLVTVKHKAYTDIEISAEDSKDRNTKGNNNAVTDSIKKNLIEAVKPATEEIAETINELKAAIKKASAITVAVNSKKVKASEISDAYAREFLKLTAAAEDKYEIAGYYNVDLKLTIKKGDDTTTHNIKNLGTTRTIKLNVSDLDFPAVPTNFSRKYYIILGHTYKDATTSRIIDANLENNVLSFGTNIFSTVYAVAYVDTPDEGLIKTIDYSELGGAKIKFISATYDGTTYTDPAKCNLFTWGETSATLPRGTELKFSLEASEDYQLSSLKIGDTDVDPNSASHTLTVGDENVAISATTERESATVKFIAKDGKIDFQGATYTNAADEEETYGSDYSDPAYSAPFGYDANNNALTLPRGATVKVKVTANSGYYLKDLTYSVGDNKEALKADEDGVYTFVLSDHQADLTADFGETTVSYAPSIEKKSDTDNDTLAYLYKNGLGHANTYRIEYIKTTTEGGKVVSTESLDTYDTPVSITLDAGAFDKVLKPSYTRTVSIVYKDTSGKVHELDKDLNKIAYDEAEGKVSFETTSFGLFTIVCADSYDESLVANLNFEDVIKQGAKVSLKKAIYNGTPINFETSSDAFSWSSTKAHFPVNTTVYFTVEAEKDYDLVSVSVDGAAPTIDEETCYYIFTAAEAGTFSKLSATTLRKSAKLLFDYNHEHGKVTIDNTDLLSGATATFTITPNQGYKVKSILATSLGDTSAPVELTSENTYSIILAPGDNTITIKFEAATEEEQPSDQPGADNPGQDQPGTDNPGDNKPSDQPGTGDQPGDDKPGDQPGDTPGTDQPSNPSNPGSGTGTGTGAGASGGDVAPIGGGSQITTSGSNSEYFLPEDEFDVVKVTNPLKNLAGKINKLTVGKKKLTVKLTKVKNAAGYQIVYRVKGTKTWKTTTTTSLTKTIKSLKKGKKYQVKVRAYKKVQGQTFYSKWSATKTTAKIK